MFKWEKMKKLTHDLEESMFGYSVKINNGD